MKILFVTDVYISSVIDRAGPLRKRLGALSEELRVKDNVIFAVLVQNYVLQDRFLLILIMKRSIYSKNHRNVLNADFARRFVPKKLSAINRSIA